MAGYRIPGPLFSTTVEPIDAGTLCLTRSHAPGPAGATELNSDISREITALQVTAANFSTRFIKDAPVRLQYIEQTQAYARETLKLVSSGALSIQEGVQKTQQMRNAIMEAMRAQTSDFGLALARFLKKEGKTLAELEGIYAKRLFQIDFHLLETKQQRTVWLEIIKKSGQPQKVASNFSRHMGHAGKGLVALTAAISFYNIAVAEDKVRATSKEVAVLGASAAGSAGLGAAGLLCGPAAIVCVPLGIFLGGMIGGLGAERLFDDIWK